MPIIIKFSSFLREITKKNEIKLDFKEISLSDLINHLCLTYGDNFKNKIIYDKTKNLKSFINIFLNKKPLYTKNENQIKIHDNDTIHFLPAISGGGFIFKN